MPKRKPVSFAQEYPASFQKLHNMVDANGGRDNFIARAMGIEFMHEQFGDLLKHVLRDFRAFFKLPLVEAAKLLQVEEAELARMEQGDKNIAYASYFELINHYQEILKKKTQDNIW